MKLELICTGEEVLGGQIVDANAAWFANLMMEHGIQLQRKSTVGDRLADLVELFQERSHQADLILVNGGLGPTSDDLSAEAAAQACGVELVENPGWRTHLESWFRRRGRQMPPSNLKQCLLPETATLIGNPLGSAPGFRIRLNRAWLFFTPGVRSEFKLMAREQFLPFLRAEFPGSASVSLSKLLTFGHGESSLAEQLRGLSPPKGISLGYRPFAPYVEIKLFAKGKESGASLADFSAQVKEVLGPAVVSEAFASLAEEVHHLMLAGDRTLALAESCSGGLLTSQLVEFAGCSNYLMQGVVAYSNAAKQEILGVKAETLNRHGAVSLETAAEMAEGVRNILNSDFGLSITGIAGPDGASESKPVGLVAVGLADKERCWVQAVRLGGRSRTLVRLMSCALALDMLRRRIIGADPVADYPIIPRMEARTLAEQGGSPRFICRNSAKHDP